MNRLGPRSVRRPLPLGSATVSFCAPALLLALLAGCSKTDESTYTIEILGPANAFAKATSVSLLLKDREVAKAAVPTTGGFSLEVAGLDPATERTTIFTVRALAADNTLVAFGQTPQIEILPEAHVLRIFVQPPATVARTKALGVKLSHGFATTTDAFFTSSLSLGMTTPLFGLGFTEAGVPSSVLYVYNPVTHQVQEVGRTRIARTDVTAVTRSDGIVLIFGGKSLPNVAEGLKATAQLELFGITRNAVSTFSAGNVDLAAGNLVNARARAAAAIAVQKRLFIGGVNDDGMPLDTVTSFDESTTGNFAIAPYPKMSAARVEHTATTDPTAVTDPTTELIDTAGRVLVYGGNTEGAVAEVLLARTAEWKPLAPVDGPTGTGRRQHQALLRPSKADAKVNQVLIIGGSDDAGRARADSVLCTPSQLRCEAGPLTLRTARKDFTVFVVRDDLVVLGGVGIDGQPIANAEIYDLTSLAFVAEVPTVARASAAASTLPNASAVILGGIEAGNIPSTAIEIYQPRRTL